MARLRHGQITKKTFFGNSAQMQTARALRLCLWNPGAAAPELENMAPSRGPLRCSGKMQGIPMPKSSQNMPFMLCPDARKIEKSAKFWHDSSDNYLQTYGAERLTGIPANPDTDPHPPRRSAVPRIFGLHNLHYGALSRREMNLWTLKS